MLIQPYQESGNKAIGCIEGIKLESQRERKRERERERERERVSERRGGGESNASSILYKVRSTTDDFLLHAYECKVRATLFCGANYWQLQ